MLLYNSALKECYAVYYSIWVGFDLKWVGLDLMWAWFGKWTYSTRYMLPPLSRTHLKELPGKWWETSRKFPDKLSKWDGVGWV